MWEAVESGDLATALIPAVWTFLGIVVVTLGTIAVQSMKGRKERNDPPPAPSNGNGSSLLQVARDVARDIGQLDQRASDNDERDDLQDRELRDQRHTLDEHHGRLISVELDRAAVVQYLDRNFPDWRNR